MHWLWCALFRSSHHREHRYGLRDWWLFISFHMCVHSIFLIIPRLTPIKRIPNWNELAPSSLLHGTAQHNTPPTAYMAEHQRNDSTTREKKNLNKFKIWCSILTACNSVNWLFWRVVSLLSFSLLCSYHWVKWLLWFGYNVVEHGWIDTVRFNRRFHGMPDTLT